MRPVIGITLDWQEHGSFSKRPHYALRDSYFHAVYAAGGLPIAIPYQLESQDAYLDMVGGMIVPGGDYPTPAAWYVKPNEHPHHPRPDVDIAFIGKMMARKTPLLGICAGMQTLGVASGGKLYLRVKDEHPGCTEHRGTEPTNYAHSVTVTEGSLLHKLTGQREMQVNSHHNEAVAHVGPAARVVATAPDGVIEAIELVNHPFALGVQWHPEFFMHEGSPDRALFEGLIAAAKSA
ncbi:MAG: gamma-glutamyl-gamma-aminobutyrate hydrolase family protein [Pseudomonadaceae bacterium]|nr:gamma-glutamyl-gamma-aminobutyrate hydrolase family protein [Pseudomonadaceae bacterium]